MLTEALPKNMKKSLPLNVPAMTLALTQVKTASRLIGGSFLFVDAKDTELATFYARYGFVALPDAPLILCMPIADLP